MPTIDLDAYLARVGLASAPPPTEAGLVALHEAQALALPFENLDVLLGRGAAIDAASLEAKLVRRRRGGYCFELNGLMLRALRALGFDARPVLGRVFFMRPPDAGVPPRTHQISVVQMGSRTFVVDVGFGLTMRRPIPLEPDVPRVQPGDVYRLSADPRFGWRVEWKPESEPEREWLALYAFTLDEVFEIDLAVANHYTATHPASPFRQQPRLARVLPEGRATMLGDRWTLRRGSEVTVGAIPRGAALVRLLDEVFGIAIDDDAAALERVL